MPAIGSQDCKRSKYLDARADDRLIHTSQMVWERSQNIIRRPQVRDLAHAREHQERGHEAWALWLLGEIAARREPPEVDKAEEFYSQALPLAEELGMRPLQAHCHRGLGTLYVATGQREQARAELSTAIEMYRTMDMTFWLPQTEAGLAQVEGR